VGPLVDAGGTVYNFVLDRPPHVIMAGSWPCVTLGHGITEPGAAHAFYGTQRCVDALRALPGWASGLVDVAETLWDADGHATGYVSATVVAAQ